MEKLRNLLFSQPHGRNEIYYNMTEEELKFLESAVREVSLEYPMFAIRLDENVGKKIDVMAINLKKFKRPSKSAEVNPTAYLKNYVARKYLAGLLAEAGRLCPDISANLLESFNRGLALPFYNNPVELYKLELNLSNIKPTFCIFQHKKTPVILQRQINDIINAQGYPMTIKYITAEDRLSSYQKTSGGIIEEMHDYSDQSVLLDIIKNQVGLFQPE